jgi:Ca2+-binding EF-hand superfamily protein
MSGSVTGVEKKIDEQISSKWKSLKKDFKRADTSRSGKVSIRTFRAILSHRGISLSDPEYALLCKKYCSSSDLRLHMGGRQISYLHFLQHFMLHTNSRVKQGWLQTSPIKRRPMTATSGSSPGLFSSASTGRLTTLSQLSGMDSVGMNSIKLQNEEEAQKVCTRLRDDILAIWKPLRASYKNLDISRSGAVKNKIFRTMLARHGIELTEVEYYSLIAYFEKIPGKIGYNSFIKYCLA